MELTTHRDFFFPWKLLLVVKGLQKIIMSNLKYIITKSNENEIDVYKCLMKCKGFLSFSKIISVIQKSDSCLHSIWICVQDEFTTCFLAAHKWPLNQVSGKAHLCLLTIGILVFLISIAEASKVFHWLQTLKVQGGGLISFPFLLTYHIYWNTQWNC